MEKIPLTHLDYIAEYGPIIGLFFMSLLVIFVGLMYFGSLMRRDEIE